MWGPIFPPESLYLDKVKPTCLLCPICQNCKQRWLSPQTWLWHSVLLPTLVGYMNSTFPPVSSVKYIYILYILSYLDSAHAVPQSTIVFNNSVCSSACSSVHPASVHLGFASFLCIFPRFYTLIQFLMCMCLALRSSSKRVHRLVATYCICLPQLCRAL